MKAKCIQRDANQILTVGKIYEIEIHGKRYYALSGCLSMSKNRFNELFEEVKE